jgi:hypothetical protein
MMEERLMENGRRWKWGVKDEGGRMKDEGSWA